MRGIKGAGAPPAERVLARIDQSQDCWVWPGSKTHNGYGTVSAAPPYVEKPRPLLVHRVLYEHFVGPIPEGMDLDHICRVRLCCNPKHLEPVTRKTNANRGEKSTRGLQTECAHGHAYPENAGYRSNGYVYCLECNRIRWRNRANRQH